MIHISRHDAKNTQHLPLSPFLPVIMSAVRLYSAAIGATLYRFTGVLWFAVKKKRERNAQFVNEAFHILIF